MCGITGFIDLKRDKNEQMLTQIVRGMGNAIAHLGPAYGIVFGHRRLAIVDLAPVGTNRWIWPMADL